MIGRRMLAVAIAWSAAVAALAAAAAGTIQVTPVVADGRVAASFVARETFDTDAEAIVRTGLLLTFTYNLELRRPSTVWMDRTLGAVTVASTVKYDNLTAVYQVSKIEHGRVSSSERFAPRKRVSSFEGTQAILLVICNWLFVICYLSGRIRSGTMRITQSP